MRLPRALVAIWIGLAALPLVAQEPQPAVLEGGGATPFEVQLDFPWHYQPGDGPAGARVDLDDGSWSVAAPALGNRDPAVNAWRGVGWFRRHLVVDPALQGRPIVLRLECPGVATLFLDGRRILGVGTDDAAPVFPAARRDAVHLRFEGAEHLLAVRYVYPRDAPRPPGAFGFRVALGTTATLSASAAWIVALRGGLVALPLILAMLHLALWAFDRRATENLYYALEMLTFAMLVVREYREVLLPDGLLQQIVDRGGRGLPVLAILFGGLTYYAIRTRPWPRSWPLFVVLGVLLMPVAYLESDRFGYAWIVYFCLLLVGIWRIERRGDRLRPRRGTRFYLASFALFGLTILLQILVNFGVFPSIGGVREIYVVGILVSAVGMSLYLASTLGESRVVAAEAARTARELERARQLQLSMLPALLPRIAGLDLAASSATATEVGGDYYDVKPAGDGALLVAFGDATGHGLAAGIVVTAAKALFSALDPGRAPAELLEGCDRAMAEMQLPTLRMCLALARITPRRIVVAAAAMPPLLVHRASSGEIEELGAGSLPLGTRGRRRRVEVSAELEPGDTLLFASDGFAELRDLAERPLGYDGVTERFRDAMREGSAKEILTRLEREGAKFRAGRPQDDDLTLFVVRVEPGSPAADSASEPSFGARESPEFG